MIRRLFFVVLSIVCFALGSFAQKRTVMPVVYRQYRPAVITFTDGHKSKNMYTNVFLKNGSLLFLKGEVPMEANMDNILAVDFEDRKFVSINKQLGYLIDSVGSNALYCIELFDKDTYERNLKNNVNISSMDLGDQISMSYIDLNNEEDYKLPVFRYFYFLYKGEFVKVHERELSKKLKKEGKTMMERIVALPDFSWQNEKSLMQLLKAISEGL